MVTGKGVLALKRNADRHIKYCNDVTSAKAFVDLMENSSTQCFLKEESSINDMQCFLQKQQHQLLVQSKNEILHRDVSCACVLSEECSGHVLKVSKVAHDQPVKDTKIVHNTCSRNKTTAAGKTHPCKMLKSNNPKQIAAVVSIPVDKRIIGKIEEYVGEGLVSSSCLRPLLEQFVRHEIFAGDKCANWTNRRFFPSQRDISDFVYAAKLKGMLLCIINVL
ncbi:unnamed protein product [Mytilus edulis]|uniref:Uncharacterized protein n=1 Tax=Mytilus edulis TaxID=6550 RepID=A0A8S3Q0N7_MYTED|nr:unnamed protein product [Mytilus edulis]